MIQPRIVVIGGGTGSFTLLQELKHWTPFITAIVNITDDGGSSGELRDELGVLPPGDVRQCLVALSNSKQTRDLFSYRFGNGKLNGHPVGNIILSALELQTGSFTQAVKIVADFMQITGQVVPVSADKHSIVLVDGHREIEGESRIGLHKINNPKAKIVLKPSSKINPEAKKAIAAAELIIIAPGNLYRSLLPTLVVEGMPDALRSTKAKVIMVANLVNKPRHTQGWHVMDYVNQMSQYIGDDTIDAVLYNTKQPSEGLLEKYAEDGEFPVAIDEDRFPRSLHVIGTPLLASNVYKQDPNDSAIKRTLIRHDAKEVAHCLQTYYLQLIKSA